MLALAALLMSLALVAPAHAASCGGLLQPQCPPPPPPPPPPSSQPQSPDPGGNENANISVPPPGGKAFGLTSQLWWQTSGGRDYVPFEVSRIHRAGGRYIRTSVSWAAFQSNPSKPPLGYESSIPRGSVTTPGGLKQLDELYDTATASGMYLVLVIADAPRWTTAYASCAPNSSGQYSSYCAPVANGARLYPTESHLFDLYMLVFSLAKRYPSVIFENYNEPNLQTGPQAPTGTFDGKMQCAVYNAAHAIPNPDPVLSSGFGVFISEAATRQYMRDFYSTGGACFDRLSVHTYNGGWMPMGAGSPIAWHMSVYRAARAEARDTRPMWVTEFGFSTANAPPTTVSEATQASATWREYNKLLTMPDVDGAFAYTLRDAPVPYYTNPNNINYGYGWLRAHTTYKQVWCDFVTRAGGSCTAPDPPASTRAFTASCKSGSSRRISGRHKTSARTRVRRPTKHSRGWTRKRTRRISTCRPTPTKALALPAVFRG